MFTKMKKTLLIWSLLLLMACGAFAQKIDARLTGLVEQSAQRRAQGRSTIDTAAVKKHIFVNFHADGTLAWMSAIALLNEGAECPTGQLQQMGIEVRHILGRMVTLRIPADKLHLLEQVEEFSYVAADEIKGRMNDAARKATGVDEVNTTAAAQAQQLPKAYTGKGVVVGIIDGGIDFNHAAFRDAEGNTRIVKAIYYDKATMSLKEVTDADEIKKLTSDDIDSHGTHTSAIVGGTDLGNGQQGMAPEADLILCGLASNSSGDNINTCIEAIFKYAENKNMPAVVNISLGNVLGLHDGSDVTARAIEELTAKGTAKGRAVVVSAGNDAANSQSLIHTFASTSEELKTVLGTKTFPSNEEPNRPTLYDTNYYLYATDYQDFTAELKLVDLTTGKFIPWGNHVGDIDDYAVPAEKLELQKQKGKNFHNEETTFYSFGLNGYKLDDSNYRIVLVVKPGHAGQTINLLCDGTANEDPCFDAPYWGPGYADFSKLGYTKGNGDLTFCTVASNPYVISVGSYITKNAWTNYLNQTDSYSESIVTGKKQVIGEISDTSSYGVSENGVKCPVVLAPGQGLVSAASNYDTEHFLKSEPGVTGPDSYVGNLYPSVPKFSRENWYLFTQGTSMSAPVVTGIIALWMQANPELTANEIINIIKETSDNDSWTTNVENIPSHNKVQAGYGKINCLKGLKHITGATAIEAISADGHRQATPASMHNVDAPIYNMKGQQVDKSYRGLVIYKRRIYLN